jgi:hypothetical protein
LLRQISPAGHEPQSIVPPQPSEITPHEFEAHGVSGPQQTWLARQILPSGHEPQSIVPPHPSGICPHSPVVQDVLVGQQHDPSAWHFPPFGQHTLSRPSRQSFTEGPQLPSALQGWVKHSPLTSQHASLRRQS